MEVKREELENGLILHMAGRLDAATAPEFEADMQGVLNAPDTNLALDFQELDYISSAGLRVILKIAKKYKVVEYDFCVCQVQDHVMEVFEMSGFEHFITIKSSLEDCVK